MTRKISLIIIAILVNQQVNAQDWFSKHENNKKIDGYVIGIAGDTIHGLIEYTYPISMQKRIKFYEAGSNEARTYSPDDIRGYGCDDRAWMGTMVRMGTYEGTFIFKRFGILQSIPGPVAIYRIFDEPDKHIKRLSSTDAEKDFKKIPHNQPEGELNNLYLRKGDEPGELIDNKAFKKNFIERMKYYTGDYEALYQKLMSKEFQLNDIFQIVNDYNRWFDARLRNH